MSHPDCVSKDRCETYRSNIVNKEACNTELSNCSRYKIEPLFLKIKKLEDDILSGNLAMRRIERWIIISVIIGAIINLGNPVVTNFLIPFTLKWISK